MKPPVLDIRGCGNSFAIWQGDRAVAGPYSSHDNAVSALRGVEQRLDPKVTRYRICTRCRTGFFATAGACHCRTCKGRKLPAD